MKRMSIVNHLETMRWHIIRCILYIVIGSIISLLFADKILDILKLPSKELIDSFLILRPTESVTIYMKTAIFTGLILSIIPIFWELFGFIKPAMSREKNKLNTSIFQWIVLAFVLFVLGLIFIYFIVLPKAIEFLINLSQGLINARPQITLTSYISFVCALLLSGGFIFQIPLIAFILTKIDLITPRFLSKNRKEAYFALCILAAIITPTTDAFSMTLFVVPMIVLYEIGILFSKTAYKSKPIPGGEVYEQQ